MVFERLGAPPPHEESLKCVWGAVGMCGHVWGAVGRGHQPTGVSGLVSSHSHFLFNS